MLQRWVYTRLSSIKSLSAEVAQKWSHNLNDDDYVQVVSCDGKRNEQKQPPDYLHVHNTIQSFTDMLTRIHIISHQVCQAGRTILMTCCIWINKWSWNSNLNVYICAAVYCFQWISMTDSLWNCGMHIVNFRGVTRGEERAAAPGHSSLGGTKRREEKNSWDISWDQSRFW